MGNSGGGMITCYAACLEERIKLAIPSCSVCSYETSILAVPHCPCGVIPGIRKYFEMGDLGCMIAPRPFVMVSGAMDTVFPFHGAKTSFDIIHSAYERIEKESVCQLIIGNGGHQFYPEEAWPVALELFQISVFKLKMSQSKKQLCDIFLIRISPFGAAGTFHRRIGRYQYHVPECPERWIPDRLPHFLPDCR